MKIAIAFLTTIPHPNTIKFASEIKTQLGYDTFIIADDNTVSLYFNDVHLIQMNDNCTKQYINSNINNSATHIKKNPIAMDKFLYAFCENYTEYDFVYVFEDDVFIPSLFTIKNLIDKYKDYDLVTPNNFAKNDRIPDWHWRHIFSRFPKRTEPFYYSMVCAMGLSRKMFDAIKEYAFINQSLFYVEVMFNTLAYDNKLNVICPLELKSIVWLGKWDVDEFLLLPNNVFHPRKDIGNHYNLREQSLSLELSNYTPKNNLPSFIQELL